MCSEVFIDMFKYLSDILAQFTAPQRILALLLLLLTIVIVTVLPGYLEDVTFDEGDYIEKVENLEKSVKDQKDFNEELSDKVIELNRKLIESETRCTDMVIAREREIMLELEELKRQLEETPVMATQQLQTQGPSSNDSIIIIQPIQVQDPRPKMMMEGIERIQRGIEVDIQEKGGGN